MQKEYNELRHLGETTGAVVSSRLSVVRALLWGLTRGRLDGNEIESIREEIFEQLAELEEMTDELYAEATT